VHPASVSRCINSWASPGTSEPNSADAGKAETAIAAVTASVIEKSRIIVSFPLGMPRPSTAATQ
jgi:hypothetical protein